MVYIQFLSKATTPIPILSHVFVDVYNYTSIDIFIDELFFAFISDLMSDVI